MVENSCEKQLVGSLFTSLNRLLNQSWRAFRSTPAEGGLRPPPRWLVVLALRARPTTQKLLLQFHLHHQNFPLLKLKTNLYSLFKFNFNSNTALLYFYHNN